MILFFCFTKKSVRITVLVGIATKNKKTTAVLKFNMSFLFVFEYIFFRYLKSVVSVKKMGTGNLCIALFKFISIYDGPNAKKNKNIENSLFVFY